jgi:hypothetical protein
MKQEISLRSQITHKQETHLNEKAPTVLPKEIPNDSRGVEHVG